MGAARDLDVVPTQGALQAPMIPMEREGGNPVLAMIERAARDPSVDLDKMERLMAMKERADAKAAEAEFNAALSEVQDKLPAISERGKATVDNKVRYTYALWEDINTAIKPILKAHGFALSFRTDFTDGIAITGVLSHRAGHSERTTIKLPSDASGSKNAVQAVASSVSYGKRYTAGALLNLTSHGEDDDAYTAAVEKISQEQEVKLREWLASTGSNEAKFLAYLKVDALSSLPAKRFDDALNVLKAKVKK